MNVRAALIFAIVLFGSTLLWTASRYNRQVPSQQDGVAAEDPSAGGETVTLRFYKNPATVAAFTARDLDGREVSSASFAGKVVILNFWATWCGPCRAEIPDLVALQDKYRDRLLVIGISQDEAPPDVVRRFAVEHKVNYPIVMMTAELERLFPGISALPTSFVLDRQSRVMQKHVGMLRKVTTELETRQLAGLPVNATVEEVDQTQGLKLALENGAQLMTIPGVDLLSLTVAKRAEALQKLNEKPCTCGCDLTVAKCRVDDPSCSVSLPIARQIVQQIADAR